MALVNTNDVSLRYAAETTPGVLPGSPSWKILEPNNISELGDTITTTPRRPISAQRGRRKGSTTDSDAGVAFEGDITLDSIDDFLEAFIFAEYANKEFNLRESGAAPSADTTGDTFAVDSISTLLGGKLVGSAGTAAQSLLYGRGYAGLTNNGLHAVDTDPVATDTTIAVETNLTTEASPPANAILEVAGVRVTDGDLTLTVSGSTATLVSASDISDWSTLGLFPGQYIHIGSATTAGVVQNALGTAAGTADDTYGYARITSISGATLNLDKLDSNIGGTADNTGDGVADIMFGRFVRNVQTTANSDDNEFLERTYNIEALYPDLGGVGTDEYEYVNGCYASELALNLALTSLATANWTFLGLTSDDIGSTRKTNAASAIEPVRTTAINTSSDIASLTTDVISASTDVCFKSLTITINNSLTREKCLGTLGSFDVATGQFLVDLEGEMLFTDKAIVNAVKNNTTVTLASILRNQDGAIAVDLPTLTLGGGGRTFPLDEAVRVSLTGATFTDPVLGHDIGISLFPFVPYA